VARLTWALLLSIALVAPDLAAKPAKRAKADKPEKADRPDKETPSGGVSFTIARPENAGMMNTIPLRLVIEPRDGIVSSKVTHLGQPKAPPKDKDKGLLLIGGDAVDMSVRPGTFSVKAVTPVELQPPGYRGTHKARAWESAVVKVQLERGEVITLVVEPGVTGADYDGSWHIGKAAPPEPESQGDDAATAPARQ
jgi:hypothetical protein